MNTSESPSQTTQPMLPPEWQTELDSFPPESYERADFLRTLGELGISAAQSESQDFDLGEPPNGFVSWRAVEGGSTFNQEQFANRSIQIGVQDKEFQAETIELVTDMGSIIRVADMRPHMSSGVTKLGPQSPREQRTLDRAFFMGIKTYADTGKPGKTVNTSKGVHYEAAGDSSMRAYWVSAEDIAVEATVKTVARLADTGDNKGLERKLYSKMLGAKL